jgi:hypothetical protein
LTACGIIARNAWSGHLSETRVGPPVNVAHEALSTGNEYYFIVPRPAASSGNATLDNDCATPSSSSSSSSSGSDLPYKVSNVSLVHALVQLAQRPAAEVAHDTSH